MTEEIEIFEERYQATRDEISQVVDNYIENRYFDGIEFLEILKRWEDGSRVYYGIREGMGSQYDKAHLLGYVEVIPLKRLASGGVRVRIVCVWAPMIHYWEELAKTLGEIFPIIDKTTRIGKGDTREVFDLTFGKPGRKPDPLYDEAYKRIAGGESVESIFLWWCEMSGITQPDKHDRSRFKAAINYRGNKS